MIWNLSSVGFRRHFAMKTKFQSNFSNESHEPRCGRSASLNPTDESNSNLRFYLFTVKGRVIPLLSRSPRINSLLSLLCLITVIPLHVLPLSAVECCYHELAVYFVSYSYVAGTSHTIFEIPGTVWRQTGRDVGQIKCN